MKNGSIRIFFMGNNRKDFEPFRNESTNLGTNRPNPCYLPTDNNFERHSRPTLPTSMVTAAWANETLAPLP